jgi:hypothetical protein
MGFRSQFSAHLKLSSVHLFPSLPPLCPFLSILASHFFYPIPPLPLSSSPSHFSLLPSLGSVPYYLFCWISCIKKKCLHRFLRFLPHLIGLLPHHIGLLAHPVGLPIRLLPHHIGLIGLPVGLDSPQLDSFPTLSISLPTQLVTLFVFFPTPLVSFPTISVSLPTQLVTLSVSFPTSSSVSPSYPTSSLEILLCIDNLLATF